MTICLPVAGRPVVRGVAAIAAVWLGAATAATAQTPAETQSNTRMYRGLFEGSRPTESRGQSLAVTFKLYEGYQAEHPLDGTAAALSRSLPTSDGFEGFTGGPVYSRRGDALSFGAQGLASFRHYHETGRTTAINELAFGWLDALPTASTAIHVRQFVRYSPFLLHGGLGNFGAGELNDLSLELNEPIADQPTLTFATNVGISQHLGDNWELVGLFAQRSTDVRKRGVDTMQRRAQVRLVRHLSTHLQAHFGYGLHTIGHDSVRDVQSHDIDTGIDYQRSLSLTRRTYFTFRTGSNVLRRFDRNSLHIVGDVGLSREIGRSWTADVSYRRRLTLSEITPEPLYYDFVTGSISGFLNRRTDVAAVVRYTIHSAGVYVNATNDYSESLGNAQVRFALSRIAGIYAQYLYYDYRLGTAYAVFAPSPRSWRSSGARVGLTLWTRVAGR